MKRVTNKTALTIYQKWMTLSASELDWINQDFTLKQLAEEDKTLVKLKIVLDDYTDKQVYKIITGLENGTQVESLYLKKAILYPLKTELRERRLNKLL